MVRLAAPFRTKWGAGVHRRRETTQGHQDDCSGARRPSARWCSGGLHDSKLIYTGRVGTGFSEEVAAELFARLETMRVPACPFAPMLAVCARS
jgi:ATP-dependent DNA ligase